MKSILLILPVFLSLSLNGCTVLSAADAVGSAVVGTAKLAVKGTVAVVDAVIPGGDDDEKEGEEEKQD